MASRSNVPTSMKLTALTSWRLFAPDPGVVYAVQHGSPVPRDHEETADTGSTARCTDGR